MEREGSHIALHIVLVHSDFHHMRVPQFIRLSESHTREVGSLGLSLGKHPFRSPVVAVKLCVEVLQHLQLVGVYLKDYRRIGNLGREYLRYMSL